MSILFVVGGAALLYLGGELMVRSTASLARALGMSALFISLGVVGFATSAPELVVSVQAILDDAPDIAVGNVVGSNIANILLVIALAALLRPLVTRKQMLYRDSVMVLGASGLLIWLSQIGEINRMAGGVMLALLAGYLLLSFLMERDGVARAVPGLDGRRRPAIGVNLLLLVIGLAALVGGSTLLIDGARTIARELGVSEAVIGLSVVAVGTSLPEIAAVVIAALRRHSDIAIGSILGSNIFNILGVLGITAMVHPVAISHVFIARDLWVMLGAALILAPFLLTGWRLDRKEGAILLALYAAYIYVLYGAPIPFLG